MEKISFRVPDTEYKKLESLRGNSKLSAYMRKVVAEHLAQAMAETDQFQQLMTDVTTIKQQLLTGSQGGVNQQAFLHFAGYIAELIAVFNPLTQGRNREAMAELLQRLKADLTGA